jgi:hypothetical protein
MYVMDQCTQFKKSKQETAEHYIRKDEIFKNDPAAAHLLPFFCCH